MQRELESSLLHGTGSTKARNLQGEGGKSNLVGGRDLPSDQANFDRFEIGTVKDQPNLDSLIEAIFPNKKAQTRENEEILIKDEDCPDQDEEESSDEHQDDESDGPCIRFITDTR